MTTSILIAKLMGPFVALLGLIALLNPKAIEEVGREFLASRAMIFLGGAFALLAGLAIVNTHNLWVANWPIIITLFGWLAIVGGVIRLAFPGLTRSIGESMIEQQTTMRAIGGCQLALGLLLTVMGYF